ncbi:MAG: hypothetical protein WCY32_06950 [Burkholderiaceae bacterium]
MIRILGKRVRDALFHTEIKERKMASTSLSRLIGMAVSLACVVLLGFPAQHAKAVPVSLDTWYEFAFGGPGTALVSGADTVLATNPPDGKPVVQVGDGPWTITTSTPVRLIVLDLFASTDQFEIFNDLTSIGSTSAPTAGGACDTDISCALGDPDHYSYGEFILAAGSHSLTGTQLAGTAGAGVFQLTEIASVPVPGALALLFAPGVLLLAGVAARGRRSSGGRAAGSV